MHRKAIARPAAAFAVAATLVGLPGAALADPPETTGARWKVDRMEPAPPRPVLVYAEPGDERPTRKSMELAVDWELHHGAFAIPYRKTRNMWVGGIASASTGAGFLAIGTTVAIASNLGGGSDASTRAAERALGVGVVMAGSGVVLVLTGAILSGIAGHRRNVLTKRAREHVLGQRVAVHAGGLSLRF